MQAEYTTREADSGGENAEAGPGHWRSALRRNAIIH